MIAKLLKLLKKNYLYILVIIGVVLLLSMMFRREGFTILDLVIPPLEKVSTEEYAYACPINGYKCQPQMIYMVKMQGQSPKEHMRYIKYKLIDRDNVVRYSGLYKTDEGLKVGSYLTFDNDRSGIFSSGCFLARIFL